MALAHSLSAPLSDPTPTSSSSAMDELIVVERRPHGSAVAVVTINRPGALNSLTRPMMVALAGAFRRLDADDTVAAVVLAGRGRAFCSGRSNHKISFNLSHQVLGLKFEPSTSSSHPSQAPKGSNHGGEEEK
ncbi:putative enoyl-CoA hydratase, mitochondrial [Ananas comosus]|uniref:Putative enoyl-CoA hydratase, mitochondrial n=1 Tax=Ananas comosus TaxID=4615 RepID=A0A199VMZ7_ANACO|nr:putative enoyl-CoA hydratase, mitochondrial [Ananas comosus]